MRNLRAALVLIVLAAAVGAAPVQAADDGLSATLVAGWDGGGLAGSWVPYTVALKNDGGRDFNGILVLRPRLFSPPAGAAFVRPGGGTGTTYEMPMALAHGSDKRVTIYGSFTDAAMGGQSYEAELVDSAGVSRVVSNSASVSSQVLALGVLSDSVIVASELRDLPRQRWSSTGIASFTAQTFPSSQAQLGGLTAIVLSNFDTSTLSQAQLHALQQYVGLGGSLILAGGASWRRTLSPLPAVLLPLRPEASSTISMEPLMELLKVPSKLEAASVSGRLAAGARPVLSDRAGNPLLIEADYGAGRIVELTYNPADEPLASHSPEYRESWAAAVNRVAMGQVPSKQFPGPGMIAGGPGMAPFGGGRQAAEFQIANLVGDAAVNALPSLGILGALLLAYVLLAGPLNYLVVGRLGRRELMWISVPLVAVLATGGAYAAGAVAHGSDFITNEVQLVRLAPDGSGDVTFYDALFSPRRGDFTVQLPEGSLGSTAITSYPQYYGPGPGSTAGDSSDRLMVGRNPRVSLRNVSVWTPRNVKLETTLRDPLFIETHLKLANGRITGSITNHGHSNVRHLELITVDGRIARLVDGIAPGAVAQVDGALDSLGASGPSGMMINGGIACGGKGCPFPGGRVGSRTSPQRASELRQVGAQLLFNGNGLVQALVGTTEPLPSLRVGGGRPTRTVTTAFVQPVQMESVDSLPTAWAPPRLIAANSSPLGGSVPSLAVLDFDLPAGATTGLSLTSGGNAGFAAPGFNGSPAPGFSPFQRTLGEIYDWKTHSWSPLDLTKAVQLTESQLGPGLVRIRTEGALFLPRLQMSNDQARPSS